jgi:predicted CoA-binding protein
MFGQYIRSIDRQLISEEDAFVWLSSGVATAETESVILTANDRVLQQKCRATEILQTETDNKCKTFMRPYNTLFQHAQY